jgi:hypothetical protein
MATVRIPISYPMPDKPTIPVTISPFNAPNKKITINLLVDTGWQENRIDLKYGQQLGLDASNAIAKESGQTKHLSRMTIGSLKPILTWLNVGTSNTGYNVFGALPMRQYDSFIITRESATITDSTTGGGTEQGLIAARNDWNKYLHGIVGGPTLAAQRAQKQALFAQSRSNSGAYWRNRI